MLGRLLNSSPSRLAWLTLSFGVAFSVFAPKQASALPWDVDMFSQENLKANEVTRAPVKGTVPVGFQPLGMTNDEASERLKNPVPATRNSAWRGSRLFSANCATCHGKKGDGKGPVGPQMAVPNLLEDFYKNRTDGRIFGVIHNGGAAMPRYGFKFSTTEHWDIVNYVRFLQGVVDVPGMKKPN